MKSFRRIGRCISEWYKQLVPSNHEREPQRIHMTRHVWSSLAMSYVLLLTGCPDGGGGGGGFEGVPFAFQAYLKASNTDASDNFGRRVALDGNTLIIGAADEDSAGISVNSGLESNNAESGSGAVYVFVRNNGTWSLQAYIKASNTESGDAFGSSVAINGDTLVVGAPNEDSNLTTIIHSPSSSDETATGNGALESGAVYVFTRSGTTWSQQAYLKASNAGAADNFGSSVAIHGDTVVIGAPGEDGHLLTGSTSPPPDNTTTGDSASASGAAYVFTRSGTTWSQQAYIKASNVGANDTFGMNVAISVDTVTVGAPGEDGGGVGVTAGSPNDTITGNAVAGSGAAYIFTRSGTTWSQQAYVKASNTGGGDAVGTSMGIDNDTAVVGAAGEGSNGTGVNPGPAAEADNTATASGAVYVFTRTGTTWSQQAYIKASNTESGDAFGSSVAINGTTLVVGAPGEDSSLTTVLQGSPSNLTTGDGALDAGAAYAFLNQGGGWSQQAYLKAPNAETVDVFGTSVSISGDTVVASATGEKSSATGIGGNQADNSLLNAGAVYVFQ